MRTVTLTERREIARCNFDRLLAAEITCRGIGPSSRDRDILEGVWKGDVYIFFSPSVI